MKTLEGIKTQIVNVENIEVSASLTNAINGEAMTFTTCNQLQDKSLSLLYIEYGEINFERKSDWTRFVNKLNDYDTTPIERMIFGDKDTSNWDGMTFKKDTLKYSNDSVLIEFDEPTPVVIETIGGNYIIAYVTQLRGQITWEWYYTKSCPLDIANICEVFITNIELLG